MSAFPTLTGTRPEPAVILYGYYTALSICGENRMLFSDFDNEWKPPSKKCRCCSFVPARCWWDGCSDYLQITGEAGGPSLDTDGGNKTARRNSLGQEKKKQQAQRNAIICIHCRLVPVPTRYQREQRQPPPHLSLSHHLLDPALYYSSSKYPTCCSETPLLSFHLYKTFSP